MIINGKYIHCEFINPDLLSLDKPLLVFLHEGLGSSEQWKALPITISNALQFPVFMYDRYGYAKSEQIFGQRSSDFLELEAADWLPKILREVGLSEYKVIIIGHSDGATIALLYAAMFPDKTLGVVSEAAHVFIDEVSISGLNSAKDAYLNGNLYRKLEKYHGDKTESMFNSWIDTWLTKENSEWNIEHYLNKITCPVLAIQGLDDNYGTPRQVYSIQKNTSGRTEIMLIENCGHIPHHEARELVEKEIIKFITGI